MSGAIYVVVQALNEIIRHWIKFPQLYHDLEHVKTQLSIVYILYKYNIYNYIHTYISITHYFRFWTHCQFPGAIGAVDGTHVAIFPPN